MAKGIKFFNRQQGDIIGMKTSLEIVAWELCRKEGVLYKYQQ